MWPLLYGKPNDKGAIVNDPARIEGFLFRNLNLSRWNTDSADKGPKLSWEATHDRKSELRHVRWLDESAVRLHLTMQTLLRSSSCPYSVNGIDEAVRGAARLRLRRLPFAYAQQGEIREERGGGLVGGGKR